MREKDRSIQNLLRPALLAAVALLIGAAGTLLAAGPGAPDTAPAASANSAPATRLAPAIQADLLLRFFPGNANLIAARNDARNFTIEGRVRDVRTVTVDPATGTATQPAPGSAAAKTEVRLVLVGRGQSDDLAAHFTCHMDTATQDDALKLKPDQLVRLTGSIGTVVAAADRIDLLNCHDLSVTDALNVGDQLVGNWRDAQVMVDGTALKKYNQTHNLKSDDIPDGSYVANWRLDLALRPDNTFAEELDDGGGQPMKKAAGRYTITKDGTDEAHLRLDVQGGTPQEATVTIDNGVLKFTPPAMSDKFLMPEQHFSKLNGTTLIIDPKAIKEQTLGWFNTHVLPNGPANPQNVSSTIDNAQSSHQGFMFMLGSAIVRSGRTTLIAGAFGKIMVLEFTPAESQANAATSKQMNLGSISSWGVLMTPEVKVDPPLIVDRAAFDPGKPINAKITYRGLRRMPDTQYNLVVITLGGMMILPLDKPGPDPQTVDIHIDRLPNSPPSNPRLIIFLIARQPRPDDLLGDPAPRVISEPIPVLLDLAPAK